MNKTIFDDSAFRVVRLFWIFLCLSLNSPYASAQSYGRWGWNYHGFILNGLTSSSGCNRGSLGGLLKCSTHIGNITAHTGQYQEPVGLKPAVNESAMTLQQDYRLAQAKDRNKTEDNNGTKSTSDPEKENPAPSSASVSTAKTSSQ